MTVTVSHIEALSSVATAIIDTGVPLVLLTGDLGAGKTALAQAMVRVMGSLDNTSSPTFSLINEYRDGQGNPIYHIDLYRLTTIEEALAIGIEDYIYSGYPCMIEWPDLVRPILPAEYVEVNILADQSENRKIRILKYPLRDREQE